MKIGCHVGNSGPLMLEGSIKEALSYGATCFMVYLGPPQNTIRKPIESMNADKMALIAKENPAKPYSDQKLVELLAAETIQVSRRAIAKYRQELNIPSSTDRKIK